MALSDLGCLRLDWPRALCTSMGRYQSDLEQLRRECRERFRIHIIRLVYILWQVYSTKSGQACRLLPHGFGTTVAVPGDMVYCMEGHAPGLYRPYEKSS